MEKLIQAASLGVMFACVCLLLNSCSYYEVKAVESSNEQKKVEQLNKAQKAQRYFVVHAPNNIYALKNVTVDSVSRTLRGTIDSVTVNHQLYIHRLKTDSSNMKYKAKKPEQAVLNEVHVFTSHYMNFPFGTEFSLPMDSIKEVQVIDKNKTRTTLSYVLGIGIPVALITTLIIIVATEPLFTFTVPII